MQRKYAIKTYEALTKALKRNNFKSPGPIATFLLDTFLENRGRIVAGKVYELGLCSEKEFRDWRKKLCEEGWLGYIIENSNITYKPGKKLVKYINREKQSRLEIASVDDVRAATEPLATKSDLEKANNRIDALEEGLHTIVNIIDPPSTDEKVEKLRSGGYNELLKLHAQFFRELRANEEEGVRDDH